MPWTGVRSCDRPRAQHRDALALHADRLARYLRGDFPVDSWRPVRLSYGLYYQLDHTSHMQRIKLPGGMHDAPTRSDALADVTDRYGRGIAHVTTRQDIQIHWVPVDEIMDMYDRLLAVGITTRGACADTRPQRHRRARTPASRPTSRSTSRRTASRSTSTSSSTRCNLTLPRKFKIAVEGCPLDCAQVPVNDIGLYAKLQDGQRGFAVYAGGGLGLAAVPRAAHHATSSRRATCSSGARRSSASSTATASARTAAGRA